MKKYFIIAAAALAGLAACTKTNLDEISIPDQKVAFEVANFTSQVKTKAAAITSENIFSFHTVANQFPTVGDPVVFMDVDVLPWNGSTQVTASNIDANNITAWSPVQDYYWPKTGWINFYSYAGTKVPAVDNNASDKKTVTFTYTDQVIGAADNILVADAALHYASSNSETGTYGVDKGESASSHVTKGVPTLFRHQLAKLIIDVEARTTDSKKSENTTWKVKVLSASSENADYKSRITPIKKGSLVLTSVEPASATTNTYAWTKTNESATNISGWVASTTDTDKEEIVLSDSQELTIPVNTTGNGTKSTILAERTVMPQLTSGVAFKLAYEVQALHGDAVFMKEIREVGITTPANIGALVNSVTSWGANQKITYHIIIDPVSSKVTFDPAVEEYLAVDGNSDVINVNEDGLVTP